MTFYDDRLDKTIRWGESAVWRCKNHPKLRWTGKNMPARSRFFAGEAPNETSFGIMKHDSGQPDPVHVLKCRLNGVNPYNTDIADPDPITTLEQVEEFLGWAKALGEKFAFECVCPPSDLELMRQGDKEVDPS